MESGVLELWLGTPKGIVIVARSLTQFAIVESMAREVMAPCYAARLCKDIGEEAI
jgi:hypothetical protein